MKKIAVSLGVLLVLLVTILVVRTLRYQVEAVSMQAATEMQIDAEAAAERLAGAVRIATVSHQDTSLADRQAFLDLHAYLETAFPRTHAALEREVIAGYSLLYTWAGRDPSLPPVVLTAHMDVVPIADLAAWTQEPFGGRILDGTIWGRGVIDDKGSVTAILEAVERLLGERFTPQRTVYIAFGHDEEVGGLQGATSLAATLKQRGVEPALVLDEGGFIVEGMIPGMTAPIAVIGLAEKGSLNLQLSVQEAGGHSSIPTRETNIGILSRAIARVEQNQMPTRLDGATLELFKKVGPHMPFTQRIIFANLWLFEPLVEAQLGKAPTTNATVRTTTAPTIFKAGIKSNVLPSSASAIVNFRLLPGDTIDDMLAHVREVVDDERVALEVLPGSREASPTSDPETPGYAVVERTIRQVFPQEDLVVAPFLVIAGTDARYYSTFSDKVYRFQPLRIAPSEGLLFHSPNERLSVAAYATMIRFFYQLMHNLEGL